MIHDRFGRNQHELLIHQLFHIRMSGSVKEYIDQFTALVDQLEAYTSSIDPLYYTMRFIDGLKDVIKAIVLVQNVDLDTACVLAQLQEEVGDHPHRKEFRNPDGGFGPKSVPQGALPLPLPPRTDKPGQTNQALDRRSTEAARAQSPEEKLAALRAYRQARGLCECCAE
uniref:Retrotransposon gag domain-containing protein n=1 Tax=Arundo donax TaxID=35708 RepID=A0A0A9AK53_ARUDO